MTQREFINPFVHNKASPALCECVCVNVCACVFVRAESRPITPTTHRETERGRGYIPEVVVFSQEGIDQAGGVWRQHAGEPGIVISTCVEEIMVFVEMIT